MQPQLIFNAVSIVGLLIIILGFYRSASPYLMLWVSGWTIVLYRLVAFFTIAYLGGFAWKENSSSLLAQIDHYQIGFAILLLAIYLKKRLSHNHYLLLLGLAFGMLIDEISELIAFVPGLGQLIPPHFRDTLSDTILIAAVFLLFAVINIVIRNRYAAET